MDAPSLIKLYKREKSSSERTNFNSLYETCAEYCNPPADNIQSSKSKGERQNPARIIDIGIKARRMFTAGMMSHLFPQGQNWIRVITSNKELMSSDNVARAMSSVTKKFSAAMEASNFYEEMGQCIDQCGYIGTTALYCESSKKHVFNWRSHYINQFYFCENYEGRVDTVIRDFKLTARQALQQFGDDLPDAIAKDADDMATSNKEHQFIHVVMPRAESEQHTDDKLKKSIASYYVSLTSSEVVLESGFDEMPYSIARFYKTNFEKYGRSPASEVINTLPMINRMEVSRIRGAEAVSNPPWLAPNDGSVRRISNDQGSIIYWNAGNPMSKPEQLTPKDNVIVNDAMIEKKEKEVLDAFYVPLFNPLMNKQNMTAYESQERLNLSLQFLSPAVNRLNKYFVKPSLERAFGIMLRAGHFPELEIPELSGASIDFDLVGKASLAARQIELFGTMTAVQQMAQIAQFRPDIFDNLNADKTARFIQEVNMMPIDMQLSEEEVFEVRQQRYEASQEEAMAQEAQVLSDAYVKTKDTPQEGSGAEAIMAMMGGE